MMVIEFEGEIWFWRGPAPWYFVRVPVAQSESLKAVSAVASYGWGCIPVNARIGKTAFYTALIPKDGLYLVPIKASVRKAERLDVGDFVTVRLEVRL